MAAYFFDTSGVAKRYIAEIGSAWVKGITAPQAGNAIYIAPITLVEVASALARRARGGTLSVVDAAQGLLDFQNDYNLQYDTIVMTTGLMQSAATLATKYALRGYDAVQLAAALQVRDERMALGLNAPLFAAADNELNAAAVAEGMLVENPNHHP